MISTRSPDYHLKSGDRVEIITFKRGGPSLDWLNPNLGYVHTNRARAKIRAWFKRQGRDKNIAEGRSLVSRELKRLGHDAMPIEQLAGLFNLTNVDDFLANVGFGDITAAQVASKILEFERRQIRENPPDELKPTAPTRKYPVNASDGINIMGDSGSGILYTLARCCNPIHGEPIIGYVTRGKGMTVHRIDCPNVANITDTERLRPANWGSSAERTYPVPVVIMAIDREGLMRDVGAMVANESINMTDVSIVNRNGMATFNVTMEMADLAQLARVLSKVEQIPNVISARRVMG
jgi:GTP pyrophosphokinase